MSTSEEAVAVAGKSVGGGDMPKHHFYINITLLNKEEALKGKVQEKTGYETGNLCIPSVHVTSIYFYQLYIYSY